MDIQKWAQEVENKIVKKLETTVEQIGASCPHAAKDGKYDDCDIFWWTNGFWPGVLWLAYQKSNNTKFLEAARQCEKNLDENLHSYIKVDHDAGFIWSLSAVADYKITGNEESLTRGLIAANYLSARFNIEGRFIRAWNGSGREGWAIIDCLMNLPLLYWASEILEDPRFRYIAKSHTDTVLSSFLRDDGSVYHIVEFDTANGDVIDYPQGQGYSPESAWSRGTAWAVYGLALGYKYTGDVMYLNKAKEVAHFFIANLPEDDVCHWDFRVEVNENTYKDTSAAACAACGLLEIADSLDDIEGRIYREYGVRILKSLTDNYANFDNDNQELIREGTSHVPQNQNINVGLIYGDYFYFEGISRLAQKENKNFKIFW